MIVEDWASLHCTVDSPWQVRVPVGGWWVVLSYIRIKPNSSWGWLEVGVFTIRSYNKVKLCFILFLNKKQVLQSCFILVGWCYLKYWKWIYPSGQIALQNSKYEFKYLLFISVDIFWLVFELCDTWDLMKMLMIFIDQMLQKVR